MSKTSTSKLKINKDIETNIHMLIEKISLDNNIEYDRVDHIVKSLVRVINEGALGEGASRAVNIMRMSRKKFNSSELIKKTAEIADVSLVESKIVVTTMVNLLGKTMNLGGIKAINKLLKSMGSSEDN